MNLFVSATSAKTPKTVESQKIAYAYAGILTILALAQLFTFNEFLTLLEAFLLPGGAPVAHLVGGLIVVSEVFALPFLLRLKVSPLMRAVSMVLGWLVPLVWLKLTLWLIFTSNPVSNIGILGTTIKLLPGWWVACISVSLGILAAWASWGLWPYKPRSNKKK